jgi:hypothetical protein
MKHNCVFSVFSLNQTKPNPTQSNSTQPNPTQPNPTKANKQNQIKPQKNMYWALGFLLW